ncbi:Fasciclin domain-containing protein [Cephalotus follicularis]|uniref:Fasciclin domain-containing protein n=1 Tax=Cephalotus follicularis TaxID=3775 RepID=A0A1Q3C6P1_CEPFO|nr:Fasciclin domain-containing protein [Cephalotus follicularis]
MSTNHLSLILLIKLSLLLLSSPILAQSPVAPAPAPSGPVNLTGILDKNGQYTTFIRLLTQTQVGDQINNQLNSSTEGMTVFAPTDNAFNNLKAGTLNNLTDQQQVQLVLYHVTPKYYTLQSLLTVSNPVRTQATGQDGGVYGLNFTGQGNQVNVSTGVDETQINNALNQLFPLAVYQLDQVLLPEELFGTKTAAATPAPTTPKSSGSNTTVSTTASPKGASGSGARNVGLGLVVGLAFLCLGVFS